MSQFIIPDILLIITYIYGLILFALERNEYLHCLSGHVFTQCATFSRWNEPKPNVLILTILSFLVSAFVCIVVSLVVRIGFAIIQFHLLEDTADMAEKILVIFSLVGFVFLDMVYTAAIVYHAAQCELNIYFLQAVRLKVEAGQYVRINDAINNISKAYDLLKDLNGRTANLTGLILFNIGSFALGYLSDYTAINSTDRDSLTATETLNTILWCILVIFPFIQAARVTRACKKMLATGPLLRGRPFQYANFSQIDLDSFCQYTNSITLQASILGIPIHPWMAYLVAVCFMFTLLVLCQTKTYQYADWL